MNAPIISLKNARWVMADISDDACARYTQMYGFPDFIARLLIARDVKPEDVEGFLNPTLRAHFPDPNVMAGMKDMAAYVARSLAAGKKIGVFADFDVDGATSAAILTRFFRTLGQDVPVYIPDRLAEGYGPNREALQSLKDQGAEIIFIADCGITAFDAVSAGRELGLSIIILDHHEPEDTLPDADHIINPKRRDDASGLTMLAACGVCFMTCVAINAALREQGFYKDKPEPPLKDWLDLVALGTVCDMVPLTGVNRLFVRQGFVQMAEHNNVGIRALCEVAEIEGAPTVNNAGWSLGPRINAGSRIHNSSLGAKLLSLDNAEEARAIAWTLEKCNEERKEIQSQMLREATERVIREGHEHSPIIIVADDNWHAGLSGLVAGKLKEKYAKPAIVVTYAENPLGMREGRGSGRSVAGVSMAQAFIAAKNAGLLIKGGGHAMAGGFTLDPAKLSEFTAFMHEHVRGQLENKLVSTDVMVDALVTVRGAKAEFIKLIEEKMGPYGMGNAEPVFMLRDVKIHSADVLKEKHIRVQLTDWEGGGRMKAMLFGGIGTPMEETLLKNNNMPVHILGQFKINRWQGRESVEIHILDIALSNTQGVIAA